MVWCKAGYSTAMRIGMRYMGLHRMSFYVLGIHMIVIKPCLSGVRITTTALIYKSLFPVGVSVKSSMISQILVYQIAFFVILSGKTYIDNHIFTIVYMPTKVFSFVWIE